MPTLDNYNAKKPLTRLIALAQPNNEIIDGIKKAESEAKELIQKIDSDKKKYDKEIEENNEEIENLQKEISDILSYKDDLIPLSSKYMNVIDSNNFSFDMAALTAECKDAVENKEGEIKNLTTKIDELTAILKDDSAKRAEAKEIIDDTGNRLNEEATLRQEINDILKVALEEDSDELSKKTVRDTLKKLNIFTEEEIENMLNPIIFPETGLKAVYEDFEGRGKSTKEMVQEALNNKDKEIEVTKEEKKVPTHAEIDEIFAKNKVIATQKVESQKEEIQDKEKDANEVKSQQVADNIAKITKTEETIEDYIKKTFNATDDDIKFNSAALSMSKKELIQVEEKLKAANINPKNVSLSILRNVEQYIANINAFLENGLALDEQTIAKNPVLACTPTDRVNNDLKLVAQNGLTLVKPTGKVAVDVVTRETNKLLKAINLIGGIDYRYFLNHPENLSKIVGGVAARMTYGIENGINCFDANGNIESIIENKEEFDAYYGPVETNIIPSAKECNRALVDTVTNPEVIGSLNDFYKAGNYLNDIKLTKDQMDRFISISDKVAQKSSDSPAYEIEINGKKFLPSSFQKNLSYLLSLDLDASDDDLILASLFFNAHKTSDDIKSIVKTFDPNNFGLAA